MKIQTSLTYEDLAKALGLEHGLTIDLVEVDRMRGELKVVVSGSLPPGTVTKSGFSPSRRWAGSEPDFVYLSYLVSREER